MRVPRSGFARRGLTAGVAGCILCLCVISVVADNPWPYLPADDIGAGDFLAEHTTYDGRGVVIAVLDTGVDAFAPGLTATSLGGIKIIEMRDFSTQGEWKIEEAELDEESPATAPRWQHPDGMVLRGAGSLAVSPVTDDPTGAPVYIGIIPESRFLNSIGDLNDDDDQDDAFGFLVYLASRVDVEAALGGGAGYELLTAANETAAATVTAERASEKVWLVVVDSDGDGDLTGESQLRDYRVNHDTFRLQNENAPESRTLMAWSCNIKENETQHGAAEPPTVTFHFDDGAHGSHCAGIAAGYQVSGQDGLNGVAPGAWLMSLTIGDNRLSGGASRTESMKKSYEYAAEFAEKYGIPVVCNMSYGINSVEEAEDSIGEWLDEFLAEHPTLYVCTSAGNEGPGLSTIGIPATSYSVISSGAYLSVETGLSLYNSPLGRNTLFTFSSRGGETAKPDIVSPGSALSTVPGYVDGSARYNGTSMASPQTAGAVACLVSGALQEEKTIHWGMVKRALIGGAARVDGLTLNDQGGGLLKLGPSWSLLRTLSDSESAHQLLWYRIETPCVFQQDGLSEAAYWRTPGGVPFAPESVTFTIHPVFHPDLTPDEKDTFFRSFTLRSEADWLEVVADKRYIRGDMGMTVDVRYDGDRLREPGLYSARVHATLDGGDLNGLAGREFALWNSVVIGDRVGPETGYVKVYEGEDLSAAWVHDYFVEVPASASCMRVRLEVSPEVGASKGARARTEINDPQGVVRGGFVGYASVEGNRLQDMTVLAPELYPGIWEINVAASRTAKDASAYKLTVTFDGYQCKPATITTLPRSGSGKAAKTSLTVTRAFPGLFKGVAEAVIDAFGKEREVTIEDTDEWSYSFTLDRETPSATFELLMDETNGNLFTDCAVNIFDADGHAVDATGFSGLEAEVAVRLPAGTESATYRLEVVGGFALKEEMAEWGFQLEERYGLGSPVTGTVERAGGGRLRFYCGVPTELDISFADSWPDPPEGLAPRGSVSLYNGNLDDRVAGDESRELVLEIPIELE